MLFMKINNFFLLIFELLENENNYKFRFKSSLLYARKKKEFQREF